MAYDRHEYQERIKQPGYRKHRPGTLVHSEDGKVKGRTVGDAHKMPDGRWSHLVKIDYTPPLSVMCMTKTVGGKACVVMLPEYKTLINERTVRLKKPLRRLPPLKLDTADQATEVLNGTKPERREAKRQSQFRKAMKVAGQAAAGVIKNRARLRKLTIA